MSLLTMNRSMEAILSLTVRDVGIIFFLAIPVWVAYLLFVPAVETAYETGQIGVLYLHVFGAWVGALAVVGASYVLFGR